MGFPMDLYVPLSTAPLVAPDLHLRDPARGQPRAPGPPASRREPRRGAGRARRHRRRILPAPFQPRPRPRSEGERLHRPRCGPARAGPRLRGGSRGSGDARSLRGLSQRGGTGPRPWRLSRTRARGAGCSRGRSLGPRSTAARRDLAALRGGGALGATPGASSPPDALQAFLPQFPVPLQLDVTPNLRDGLFAAALTLLTGLVFGLVPAARTARVDCVDALKQGGRGIAPGLTPGSTRVPDRAGGPVADPPRRGWPLSPRAPRGALAVPGISRRRCRSSRPWT